VISSLPGRRYTATCQVWLPQALPALSSFTWASLQYTWKKYLSVRTLRSSGCQVGELVRSMKVRVRFFQRMLHVS
jgi:ABC-type glycerol-3-phosphate transport system permease component